MNQKILMGMVIIVCIAIIVIAVMINNHSKTNPEKILELYIANLNQKKYEENYSMLTESSKLSTTLEKYVERNKNIYEGINMENMQIEVTNVEKKDDTARITYQSSMETAAGTITFINNVELEQDKKNGYLIAWNSKLIFPQLNDTDKVRIKTTVAKRGEILDKNGTTLAGEGKVYSVGLVPGKIGEDKEEKIAKVAKLLNINEDTIYKALSASWVKDDVFVPLKKVAVSETSLKNALLAIPGIKINTVSERIYPLGESAAHLTGYVQNITAEELEKYKDMGYNSNSIIGKAGLEKQYEQRLKGQNGAEIYIEDEKGNKKAEIKKQEAQNGETITLTIDANIQTKLYNELKKDEGLFVVMEPKTGALLALVSTPSYDPNQFILGMTEDQWSTIRNNEQNPMLTRYLQAYCPGSTFKPITGAIGLTTNSLSVEDTFSYEGLSWQKDSSWGDYQITTLRSYTGTKNLKNAIIYSDNIYFAQATLKMGKENFINGLKKIRFGGNLDFILSTAQSQYSNTEDIQTETLLADSGYGQGQILVNPIHMASIYSAFVNEGNMVKPYLEKVENKQTEYLVENAFSKEAANTMKEAMIQVIENPEGTGSSMKVVGRTIAGKTGTAELKTEKGETGETLAWFDCITADNEKNQLLVISMVENGNSVGGSKYLIKKIKTLF